MQQANSAVVKAVSFYLVTSITMVLVNKWLLADLPDMPLLILWLQIVIAVALMACLHWAGFMSFSPASTSTSPPYSAASRSAPRFPSVDSQKCYKLIPLIVCNVVGLGLNTYCLVYIEASMYQVARSLVLPITVIMQWAWLHERSPLSVVFACSVVCMGFVVGSSPSLSADSASASSNFWTVGLVFGVLSSVTTAAHSIVIKQSVAVVSGDTLVLAWYNNVLSALLLFPVVALSGQFGLFSEWILAAGGESLRVMVVGTVVTGLFGFLINLAGFLQIKITSPVTHMISSAVRGVLQTVLAVVVFGDVLTGSRVFGIILILAGSSMYTWLKSFPSATIDNVDDDGRKMTYSQLPK